jgi:hypothetical protein
MLFGPVAPGQEAAQRVGADLEFDSPSLNVIHSFSTKHIYGVQNV